jgi:hypothetical protein
VEAEVWGAQGPNWAVEPYDDDNRGLLLLLLLKYTKQICTFVLREIERCSLTSVFERHVGLTIIRRTEINIEFRGTMDKLYNKAMTSL